MPGSKNQMERRLDSGKLISELFRAVKRAEQTSPPEGSDMTDAETRGSSETEDCEQSKRWFPD
jgi:hypothetical protein